MELLKKVIPRTDGSSTAPEILSTKAAAPGGFTAEELPPRRESENWSKAGRRLVKRGWLSGQLREREQYTQIRLFRTNNKQTGRR
jgi:hypothetical protein